MKCKLGLLLFLTLLLPAARAEEARFFRITGPVVSTITAFSADGYVTWTNAPTNATFTVQTTASLVGPSNWVDYVQVPVTNPSTTHRLFDPNPPAGMVLIPAGSFTMGDTFGDWPSAYGASPEIPLHTVQVSAFYLDKYEVTKALWDDVYQWGTNHGYSFESGALGKAATHPVHSMTWYDAAKWCNARSEKAGRLPAYYTDAARTSVYRGGQTAVQNDWVNWNAGYRLPTEAEWEKAARGGASGHRFPWADTDEITHSRANYQSSSNNAFYDHAYDTSPTRGYHPTFNDGVYPFTSPVGYFAANGYGLYDMAGNLEEWCWDWPDTYSSASQVDPRGIMSGSGRAVKGGSWGDVAWTARMAVRGSYRPTGSLNLLGFRTALPTGP